MSCALNPDAPLHVCKGATFTQVFTWATDTLTYKPITGITNAAPAVVTAVGHGLPDRWKVAIASVKGMTFINAEHSPPRKNDFHIATVLTGNTISLNDTNSLSYGTYTSGGTLIYNTPVSLATADVYMVFLDKENGTEYVPDKLTVGAGITLDDTLKTITASMSAATTDALTWTKAYYILFADEGGVITALFEGPVTTENLIL